MRKKSWYVALGVCLLMTGCAGTAGSSKMDDYVTNKGYESKKSTNVEVTTTKVGTKVIPKDKVKIGVLYIGSASDTSGYTYTHELGIKEMAENLGLSDKQIVRKEEVSDSDEAVVKKTLQECVDDGCNIIFGTSWGYMKDMEQFAQKYPDIYFAHGTGYLSNGKNFTNYFGRVYQARYLSGIVAGMKTKTNKIGYVAAMGTASSEVTGGIDAFALGVESVNPKAEIDVKVTNSWYDPAAEKQAADKLLDVGCDVLAQHCDTTAPQVEAQKKGVWGIGYNSDMSKETPKTTLTSVIWNWSAYYTSYVQSIMDGSYDGKNYYEGMSVGLVGLSGLSDLNDASVGKKVKTAEEKIMDGTLGVFDGKMETNKGKTVGTDGATLDDATISGKINWYYHTVKVIK